MVRYKDNERESANLITMDPDGTKWVHTGDLGYVDEQGFFFNGPDETCHVCRAGRNDLQGFSRKNRRCDYNCFGDIGDLRDKCPQWK